MFHSYYDMRRYTYPEKLDLQIVKFKKQINIVYLTRFYLTIKAALN